MRNCYGPFILLHTELWVLFSEVRGAISNLQSLIFIHIGWLLCQRLHAAHAVVVGVSLAHGQVSTIVFNLFLIFVHLLHENCTLYILCCWPLGSIKIPDSTIGLIYHCKMWYWLDHCPRIYVPLS